jgi:hypothetical protein
MILLGTAEVPLEDVCRKGDPIKRVNNTVPVFSAGLRVSSTSLTTVAEKSSYLSRFGRAAAETNAVLGYLSVTVKHKYVSQARRVTVCCCFSWR